MHTFNPTTQEVGANGSLRVRGRKEGRKERKRIGRGKAIKGQGRWCHISMYVGCAQKKTPLATGFSLAVELRLLVFNTS